MFGVLLVDDLNQGLALRFWYLTSLNDGLVRCDTVKRLWADIAIALRFCSCKFWPFMQDVVFDILKLVSHAPSVCVLSCLDGY